METVVQDLRYGLRTLWKSPGFALVSTVTLALAIGVNTSIFSLVSVVIFADLPMQDRETVALIRAVNPELGVELGSVSPADYLDLVERNRSFASLSALTETQWVLTGQDRPTRVQGLRVTAGTTETWRLPPVLGRGFLEGEDLPGAPHVAMLTHGYWQREYGGRPDVLGEILRLDGVEHTVIGVMHPKLEFAEFSVAEVVVPLVLDRSEPDRAGRYLYVSGRLAPGVPQEAATEEVRRIGEELAAEHPVENTGWRLRSAPVMDALIDRTDQTLVVLLQLTVGMVILIACANVANMILARAIARAREIAVRHALGAGRRRLVRQLLTESLIISLASASLGLAVAKTLNEAMIWISAGTSQAFLMADLDWRVLLFTLLVSLVAPMVFGLLPALRASAGDPSGVLRDGRSGDGCRAGKRSQAALVTAQVSLALTLMIVAVLLTRSVINLDRRPLGYDEEDLLTVLLDLPEDGYDEPEARRDFFARAGESVSALPSLGQTELASSIPGVQQGRRRSFLVEGREVVEGVAPSVAMGISVSRGLFDLVGLEIVRGRGFEPQDGPDSPPVTVISRELAHRHWPTCATPATVSVPRRTSTFPTPRTAGNPCT
jgi:predicted permease